MSITGALVGQFVTATFVLRDGVTNKKKSMTKAQKTQGREHRFTGERNEWITPPHIIDAARSLLGPFCDPFTHESNPTNADVFYTEETNALTIDDWGRDRNQALWLNPPFSGGSLREILTRIREEVDGTRNERPALLLLPVNNRFETEYYHHDCLNSALTALIFLRGRQAFCKREEGLFGVDWKPHDSNLYATHILAYNLPSPLVQKCFGSLGTVCGMARRNNQ